MKKIIQKMSLENLLCLFIILCPILDMVSFLFRNSFKTSVSPSTVIRPLIPIAMIMIIFFKNKLNMKMKLILGAGIYFIYGAVHLFLFHLVKTGSSYSSLLHEAQYITNYSFMILNLFIFLYVFWRKDTEKMKKSILISSIIYIVSIYISIITKTSSSTYIEGMGYKGWFESGNSISAILILSLFIITNIFKDKRYRYIVITAVILIGIFLTTLIGTRVGLFGFILVLFVYIAAEICLGLINKYKINKKVIIGGIIGMTLTIMMIALVGSNTIQRRQHLKEIEDNIIEKSDNQEVKQAHISGSLLEIKEKIDKNELEERIYV